MTFLYIILSVIIGFCLCGAWFRLCALFSALLKKYGAAAQLSPLLASVPFVAALKITAGFIPQKFEHTQTLPCAAAVLAAVLLSAAAVNLFTLRRRLLGKELFWLIAGGAFMEVPQRLFMQGALFAELCASFIFSVGVGFAYQQTGAFVICALAHAAERAIGNMLAKK